ncbi:MAG: glycosyltransferase family 2 protein [Thiohalobacterales bacterium]|nr:glycosyltransferase family 2 protein [Thiohalobacterales bacterium]
MSRGSNPGPCRLALVVIARDEAGSIQACLESAAPYVEQMVVLDTGSTDDTPAIAESCGATVHHYPWHDDFAAARNAALEQSPAAWNLILDADERIVNEAGQLGPGILGEKRFIGLLPVTSEFELQDNVEKATSWLPRMLPAGVRYTGRIHEQPVSDLPRIRLPLEISHTGYRQSELAHKKGRNRALLLRMLEDSPEDAYLLYQTGKDFEVYGQFNDAVGYYEKALARSTQADPFRHDLVLRMIYSLKRADQLERGIRFAEQEMPNWPHSPDYFFALGDLLLEWATRNPEQALQEILPMVESSWSKCLEIGDQPALEGSVHGRGSHLAAHNLAVLYDGLGRKEQAEHFSALATRMRAG